MPLFQLKTRHQIEIAICACLAVAQGAAHGQTVPADSPPAGDSTSVIDQALPQSPPTESETAVAASGEQEPLPVVELHVMPAGSSAEGAATAVLRAAVLRLGKAPATLEEVRQWSEALTQALRNGGFPLGQVLMGQSDWQATEQGSAPLTFSVFPGRISEVVIENKTRVKDARLQRLVNKALCGKTTLEDVCMLQTSRLERTTQLLQDVPGVAIAEPPQFAPGAETGDVRVVFSLEPAGKPVQGSVVADNKGIPSTGRYRFGFSVSGNNVFGAGENYGLALTGTNEGMWTGSLNASMPILDDGLRVAAGITRQEYTINSIARLTGVANIAQLGLVYPIARGLDSNIWLGASYLHSKTKSEFNEFSLASHSTIDAGRISLQANNGDRPRQLRANIWSGELALTYGHQSNDTPLLDQAANIGGNYFKLAGSGYGTYGLNRSGDVFVSGRFNAQVPNRNLDPSEKLIIGGPDAVRAYRPDEGSLDEGIVLNLGLYKRIAIGSGHQLQAGVFNDFAFGRVNHSPWPNWELSFIGVPGVSNHRVLGGYGLGVDWLTPIGILFSASVSKAYGFSSTSWVEPGKKPVQYWLSVSWSM